MLLFKLIFIILYFQQFRCQNTLTPISNETTYNDLHQQLIITKNCSINVCVAKLILTVKPNINEYIVGSGKKIELDISVLNRGDDAFESILDLFILDNVNFINITNSKNSEVKCYNTTDDIINCDIGNALTSGKKIEFTILMEPNTLKYSDSFQFVIIVKSTNLENKNYPGIDSIEISIKHEANLTVYGSSQPSVLSLHASELTFRPEKQFLEDIGPEVSHTYTLVNSGNTTIKKADVTILWPTADPNGNFLLYLVDQPIVKAKPGKVFCKSILNHELNPLGLKSMNVNSNSTTVEAHTFIENYGRYNEMIPFNESHTNEGFETYNEFRAKRFDRMIEQLKSCATIKCTRIICSLNEIETNESVSITISSRYWKDSTELEGEPYFQISSKLVSVITELPYDFYRNVMVPNVHIVSTQFNVIGLHKIAPISWLVWLVETFIGE